MAKDTYKKRAKNCWNSGKSCKGDGEERQYSKTEIRQAIDEIDEAHLTRYKGKRKRNRKASLEHTIAWYKEAIARYKHGGSYRGYLDLGLREAEKEYKQKYAEKDKK